MIRVNCHHHHHHHHHHNHRSFTSQKVVSDKKFFRENGFGGDLGEVPRRWRGVKLILLISFEGKIEFSVVVSFSSVCCLSRYIVLCCYDHGALELLGAFLPVRPIWGQNGPFKAPWECQKGTGRCQNA